MRSTASSSSRRKSTWKRPSRKPPCWARSRSGAAELDSFARQLLGWFAEHGRHDLPWQIDATPYRVWVSEIMLQQTQVKTVIPYFERFAARLPDLASLAAAPLDDVLAHWSGLGYYARARNLHAAAKLVHERHGGEMPRSLDALTALPGIGRSTAGAILALAFGERQPILDGNVKRALARFHAVEGWPGKAEVAQRLWRLADTHTPSSDVAAYTQAIMDLGATVCMRAEPRCGVCPVAADCAARKAGLERALPTPRKRAARPARRVTVLIVRNTAGQTLLERRPLTGIWGGLLSFPELDGDESAEQWCRRRLGKAPFDAEALAAVEHAFTHFDLTLAPVRLAVDAAAVMDHDRWLWYNSAEPLPGGIAAPIGKILRAVIRAESLP
jgi:A/G-specific adenine glycosylase